MLKVTLTQPDISSHTDKVIVIRALIALANNAVENHAHHGRVIGAFVALDFLL